MSIRSISFIIDEYYHVYNRGNSKQKIFNDTQDYSRFVGLLYACNQANNFKASNIQPSKDLLTIDRADPLVAIGAFCVMPNHFHILITPIIDNGVSRFMQKLSTAYSMYYNKKYKRTGALFEGKFKAEHAHEDRYLRYLYAYIHLNPLKLINPAWREEETINSSEAIQFLSKYRYSSFNSYRSTINSYGKMLNPEYFPPYLSSPETALTDLLSWLEK